MSVKAATIAVITQDAFLPLWRSVVSDRIAVFMLHRFADDERRVPGESPDALRANLEFLRRHRYHLASLKDLVAESGTDRPDDGRAAKGPTVVFTVDDGYADFARIAAPIFAEFDCPVTVFTVTDAIEGKLWFWWDRVEFVLTSSRRETVDLELSTGRLQRPRSVAGSVQRTTFEICEALKRVANAEKEQALVTLAASMGVEVPSTPPPRYAAMTWSDVQRCAQRGVTFGPHTVRHPMLTRVDEATATAEILDSWTRLRERCDAVVPVFCYPNGSFGQQHIDMLARSPLRAALSTDPGYATRASFTSPDPATRFAIPRFVYSGERERFVQVVAGVERVKLGVRGAIRALMRN
jgi:peptidoglycan/xylan/chitin deacetylase (PgdA/CDA1 family)